MFLSIKNVPKVLWSSNKPLNLKDFMLVKKDLKTISKPLVAVLGTGIDSGKTTVTSFLIKSLSNYIDKISACKLAGTASQKDLYSYEDSGANKVLDFNITDVMFGNDDEALKKTSITQPAIFLHSVITAKVIGEKFNPGSLAGHSLGEFSALVAGGFLKFEDGLILVQKRAQAMQKACEISPSTMAAIVGLENEVIEKAKGNCHSLSLDLYDQWTAMEKNKQWRFTPPTHVLAAFNQAITEHKKEGGIEGRHKRYKNNCKIICEGMKEIGFEQLLPDDLQAPIIITFKQPNDPNFNFQKFYNALSDKNFLIYPGKLTVADTFRIGCIGNLNDQDMRNTLVAVKEVISDLKINL